MMKPDPLTRLLAAARQETAPAPGPEFADGVLRAIRRYPVPAATPTADLRELLNDWFPRVTLAAAAVVLLCAAADWGGTACGLPELGDAAAQVACSWIFNPENI